MAASIKKEHVIAWVLLAVAVLIIIWLLMRPNSTTTINNTQAAPDQNVFDVPGFAIPGVNNANPTGVAGIIQQLTIGASPPPIFNIDDGDCMCGCSGPNGGAITYTFPDTSAQFNALQSATDATYNAGISDILGSMTYGENVFVTNASNINLVEPVYNPFTGFGGPAVSENFS